MKRVCRRLFSSSSRDEFLFLGDSVLMEKLKALQSRFSVIASQLEEAANHDVVIKLQKEKTELAASASLVASLVQLEKALDECEELERSPDQDPEMAKFVQEEKMRLQGEIASVEQVRRFFFFFFFL
jgi:protein subunit release factor A